MPTQHLHKIFTQNPTRNFLTDSRDGKTYTYEAFFNSGSQAADFLQENNITKVALIIENSVDLLALYLGALLEGICVIPIDPLKSRSDMEEILRESECKQVICNEAIFQPKENGLTVHHIENIRKYFYNTKRENDYTRLLNIQPEKLFTITFTSGTSGKPKGVMHSFQNLFGAARAFGAAFEFGESHTFYHNLPMTYMAGLLNLFLVPLCAGSRLVLGNRFSIGEIRKFWTPIVEHQVNAFFLIPTIVSLLMKLDKGETGINYCKNTNITACIGTAPLDQNLRIRFKEKYGLEVYESYGLSETLFNFTNAPKYEKIQGVGKALEGLQYNIAEDGEIELKAPWNFIGYFNMDKADFFKNDRFTTGDLGQVSDGFLTINGRKKDLIIKGGVNISPAKIERTIQASGLLSEFVIAGAKDEITGEKTVCFYIQNEPIEKSIKKQLNRKIEAELGRDYLIDDFRQIEEFPRNINGKIDKKELYSLYEQK